jgi:glycosyltransferase involved in cell wall biosynthesis
VVGQGGDTVGDKGSQAPTVSIGLPVYNGARYVREAIDSILSQEGVDLELIIGDNGSTDATPRICREVAAGDRRVRYLRSEENRGASWNYNRLVEEARRAEYFKWAPHDDVIGPGYLKGCVDVLDRDRVSCSAMLSRPTSMLMAPSRATGMPSRTVALRAQRRGCGPSWSVPTSAGPSSG